MTDLSFQIHKFYTFQVRRLLTGMLALSHERHQVRKTRSFQALAEPRCKLTARSRRWSQSLEKRERSRDRPKQKIKKKKRCKTFLQERRRGQPKVRKGGRMTLSWRPSLAPHDSKSHLTRLCFSNRSKDSTGLLKRSSRARPPRLKNHRMMAK